MPNEDEVLKEMERLEARRRRRLYKNEAFERIYGREPAGPQELKDPPIETSGIVGIRGIPSAEAFGIGAVVSHADQRSEPQAPLAHDATLPVSSQAPAQKCPRMKPGPKTNRENALRVLEIVMRVAGSGKWKSRLDDICEALDEEGVPYPKTWPQRETRLRSWTDAGAMEPALAKKAIEHHLKVARA